MKKKQTYADQAKSIMNKYKLRLGEKFDKGDNLSLEAMNKELAELRQQQEADRPDTSMGGEGLPMHVDGGELAGMAGGDLASYSTRVPWVGAASGIVESILANRPINLPEYNYNEFNPTALNPNLVDYSFERESAKGERDLANAEIRRASKGVSGQNQLTNQLLTGYTGTQRATGQQIGRSVQQEENVNAQIKNDVAARNAASQFQAAQINMRNKMFGFDVQRQNSMIDQARKDAQIGGIVDSIQGYGQDLMDARMQDQMLQVMAPENYKATYGDEDTLFKQIFQIPRKLDMGFVNTGDTLSGEQGSIGMTLQKLLKQFNNNPELLQQFLDSDIGNMSGFGQNYSSAFTG